MFQQTIIVGNLGSDPEMRYLNNGTAVCSFSVAVNRYWNDQAGNRQESTTWFRATCWRKLAEVAAEYLSKGRQVMLVGDVKASAWTNKDGEAQASLELNVRDLKFLGSRNSNGNGNGNRNGSYQRRQVDPTTGEISVPDMEHVEDIPF